MYLPLVSVNALRIARIQAQARFKYFLLYQTQNCWSTSVSSQYSREARSTVNINSWSKSTMSDDAYSAFLDQANQDTGESKASTKSSPATTRAVDTDVPVPLQKVEQYGYYSSEADEPFEPVSLKWSGDNPPSQSTPCPPAKTS